MVNVTYLLGAGASYGAIPLVNELPIRAKYLLTEIPEALKGIDIKKFPHEYGTTLQPVEFWEPFQKVMLRIASECTDQFTIDALVD